MATPTMTTTEARLHATFTALMWALSFPGRARRLPATGPAAIACIAEALIDLETTYYTPDPELAPRLARTGARAASLSVAKYHFYPTLRPIDAEHLAEALAGSYTFPDDSATIVAGCSSVGGMPLNGQAPDRLRLRGPGIAGATDLQLAGVPASFWIAREKAIRYPLGWDVFLVAHDLVVGLPRTTVVEVLP
jgi:alpha-D-ribose 1-methylphosphonate 5-triphosphate synthase subunit PhnH